ncbi:hypothetical protein ABRP59_12505 [Pectobacterium punjabense]|uniref:hypothetical protein n=1 Tax=Pectobacterium punjabense TaxID=2108399 RepID=UPI0032EFC5DC
MRVLEGCGNIRFFKINYQSIDNNKCVLYALYPASKVEELNDILDYQGFKRDKPEDLGIHKVRIQILADGDIQFIVRLTENEKCQLQSIPIELKMVSFTSFTGKYREQHSILMGYFNDEIQRIRGEGISNDS